MAARRATGGLLACELRRCDRPAAATPGLRGHRAERDRGAERRAAWLAVLPLSRRQGGAGGGRDDRGGRGAGRRDPRRPASSEDSASASRAWSMRSPLASRPPATPTGARSPRSRWRRRARPRPVRAAAGAAFVDVARGAARADDRRPAWSRRAAARRALLVLSSIEGALPIRRARAGRDRAPLRAVRGGALGARRLSALSAASAASACPQLVLRDRPQVSHPRPGRPAPAARPRRSGPEKRTPVGHDRAFAGVDVANVVGDVVQRHPSTRSSRCARSEASVKGEHLVCCPRPAPEGRRPPARTAGARRRRRTSTPRVPANSSRADSRSSARYPTWSTCAEHAGRGS